MFEVGDIVLRKKEYLSGIWFDQFRHHIGPFTVTKIQQSFMYITGSKESWDQKRFVRAKGVRFMEKLCSE